MNGMCCTQLSKKMSNMSRKSNSPQVLGREEEEERERVRGNATRRLEVHVTRQLWILHRKIIGNIVHDA